MKKIIEQVKKMLAEVKAGKEISEADLTAAFVLTSEDVEAYLNTDEGKKLILPKIDAGVTKGIESFKKNNLDKLVEEKYNATHPPLTEDQKKMQKLEADFQKEKSERVREQLKNKLISEATKKSLPVDMVDILVGSDEEASLKNLDLYEQTFNQMLSAKVEERFAAGGRKPEGAGNGGKPPKSFTREQMKDVKFVNDNWDDVQEAMVAGNIK